MPFLKPLSLNDKLITFNHFIMSVLIGKKAPPAFRAQAVINGSEIVENFSLEDYIGKKNMLFFFFYPADFTFVCPTELHAFQIKLNEFEGRDTVVVAASTDSAVSHWKWLQTPKTTEVYRVLPILLLQIIH